MATQRWKLARVRMESVGPAPARFDRPSSDSPMFIVDLTGTNGQPDDTVLWLENGGGKTVFLALLFHVLRPDQARRIGDDAGKRSDLRDLVGRDDVAQIAIELAPDDPTSSDRLIVGLTAERRASSSGEDVNRVFWRIRSDGSIRLEDLPFVANGRRLRPLAFREQLTDLVQARGRRSADTIFAQTITDWLRHLDDAGVDPALARYEVNMNRKESGATALFQFKSDADFLRFLFELTLDDEQLATASADLATVADEISQLPMLELESDWVAGALDHLDPLAVANAERTAALEGAADADAQAHALARQLAAREAALVAEATEAEEERKAHDENRLEADRARRRAEEHRNEALREEATRAHLDKTARAKEAKDAYEEAERVSHAWQSVPVVLRVVDADAQLESAKVAYEAAHEGAAPLLGRRDYAGTELRGRLAADAHQARVEARSAETSRDAAQDRAGVLRAEEQACRDSEAAARTKAMQLREALDALAAAIQDRVDAGDLESGESPTEAVATTDALIEHLDRADDDAREQRQALVARRDTVEAERVDVEAAARGARRRADETRLQYEKTRDERDALATQSRVVAVAEVDGDAVDLDAIGAALIERLTVLVAHAHREQLDLAASIATDRRAAAGIDNDALWPPRPEAVTVVEALRSADITGYAGWRWLADAARPDTRDRIVAALPHLADGVLVAPDDFPRVEAALESLQLPAAVAIGTTEAIAAVERGVPPPDVTYVVAAAPSLYDTDAAFAVRDDVTKRIDAAETDIRQLDDAIFEDRMLATKLEAYLIAWPAGALGMLETAVHTQEAEAHGLGQRASALADEAHNITRTLDEMSRHLEQRARERRATEHRRRRLEPIARRAHELEHAEDEIATAEAAANEARIRATVCAGAANDADEEWKQLSNLASDKTALATGLDSERRRIDAPPHAVEVEELALTSNEPIATLHARFESADLAWRNATEGSDAARAFQLASEGAQSARAELERLDDDVRALAQQLTASPDAADEATRNRAARRARDHAGRRQDDAFNTEAAARQAREEVNRRGGPLEDRSEYEDLTDAEVSELARTLDADVANAYKQAEAAEYNVKVAERRRDNARTAMTVFSGQRKALASAFPEVKDVAAGPDEFDGDPVASVETLLAAQSEARSRRERAAADIDRHAANLAHVVQDDRFRDLDKPVHKRLRTSDTQAVAADAARLVAELRVLGEEILERVGQLDAHREVLVTSTAELGDAATSAVRLTESLSRLPRGLGDWSRQPFVRIRLEVPKDEIARRTRIRQLVTRLIEDRAAGRDLPTGASFAVATIEALSEREPAVRVLKPSRAQTRDYVPITEMAKLSGGMRATAAIAMFCTLAAVRTRNHRGGGGLATLVLDNPFGDANANFLVSLQRQMARQAGVQLVYASGIGDRETLATFPVTVRLANRLARQSTLQYVTITGRDVTSALANPMGVARIARDEPLQLSDD
jgi:hypothetical protein